MGKFTLEGYQRSTADELKATLTNAMTQYNPYFAEWPADVQNNMLDVGTVMLLELENTFGDIANSFAPGTANDFMWEQLAQSLSLKYKDESKASVTLRFSGNEGVFIPDGTEVTGGFKTNGSCIIDSTGTAYASAESDTSTVYAPNTITSITSTVDPSVTVTNPSSSIAKTDSETNEELKIRAQRLIRSPRIGSIDYAISKLTELEGIEERLINFSFISTTQMRGIEAVIGGGDTAQVAKVLFESFLDTRNLVSAPSSNETDRTVSYELNYNGSPLTIKWTLAKELKLNIAITVAFRYVSIYEGTLAQVTQDAFTTELNNRKVGVPVNKNLFDSIVYEQIQKMGVDMQYVQNISYILQDATDEDNIQTINFDSYGYIAQVYKDVYTTMGEFELSIATN